MLLHFYRKYRSLIITIVLIALGGSWLFSLGDKGTYHFHIPVNFTSANTPYIEMVIDNEKYPMVLDLGSKFQMTMKPNILANLPKKSNGIASWMNIKGIKHTSPKYILPKVEVGPLVFNEIVAVEKAPSTNCILWSDPDIKKHEGYIEPAGYLGKNFLQQMNLLFDLGRSNIIASNSTKLLKKGGYDIKSYFKVPIEITTKFVIIQVKTDFGLARLVLDTGATQTILRKSLLKGKPCETTYHGMPFTRLNRFVIEGQNYEGIGAYLLDVPKEMVEAGIDGLLGMDFFKNHIIYLNFKDKTAYIQK